MRRPLRSWKNLLGMLGLQVVESTPKPRSSKRQRSFESLEDRSMMATLYWDTNGSTPGLGGAGTWDLSAANWTADPTGSSATQAWNNSAGDEAVFGGNGTAVTIGSGIQASSLKFESSGYTLSSGSLTVNGTGEIQVATGVDATISTQLTGSTELRKTGSGSLTLAGNNTISGGTEVAEGALRLAHTSAAGNGTIEIGNGTLSLYRSGATTTYGNAITSLSGTMGILKVDGSGSDAGAANNSTFATGTITVSGSLTFTRPTGGSGYTTFSGVLAGNGTVQADNTNGGVAVSTTAPGRLSFSNTSNTFNGNINVLGGGNYVNSTASTYNAVDLAAGGYLTIVGAQTTTVGALTGTGTVTKNVGTNNAALVLGAGNATSTFSGVIAQTALNATGTVTLTKTGTGTLTLTGANTYGGSTTISGGVLQVGSNGTTGSLGTGSVVNNATLTVNRSNSTTVANVISGTGSFTQAGSGTLALSGNNTFSGGSSLEHGILVVSHNSALGTGIITLAGGKLQAGSSARTLANALVAATGTTSELISPTNYNLTLNGNLTGNGTINKSGAYSVYLSGDNSAFAGVFSNHQSNVYLNTPSSGSALAAWEITGGDVLAMNFAGDGTIQLGSLAGTTGRVISGVTNGIKTLEIGALGTSTTYAGTIQNHTTTTTATVVNVVKKGTGSLTLSGANTFTGDLTIESGSLTLANNINNGNSDAGKGTITVGSGASLTVSGTNVFGTGANLPTGVILEAGSLLALNGSYYAQLPHVTLNDAAISSGAGNATYGSWAFMGGISAAGSANSSISGQNMYLPSTAAVDVAAGAVLEMSANFENTPGYGSSTLTTSGDGQLVRYGNLVINGSFEKPGVATGTFSYLSSIPGWTLARGSVFEIQDHYNGLGGASEGQQHLQLDSDDESSDVQQDIRVSAGRTYSVSFDFRGRPDYTSLDNQLTFQVLDADGEVILQEIVSTEDTSNWHTKTFEFLATSDNISLKFIDSGPHDKFGIFLDNVKMQLVAKGEIDFANPFVTDEDEEEPGATMVVGQEGKLAISELAKGAVEGQFYVKYDSTKVTLYTAAGKKAADVYASETPITDKDDLDLWVVGDIAGSSDIELYSKKDSNATGELLDWVKLTAELPNIWLETANEQSEVVMIEGDSKDAFVLRREVLASSGSSSESSRLPAIQNIKIQFTSINGAIYGANADYTIDLPNGTLDLQTMIWTGTFPKNEETLTFEVQSNIDSLSEFTENIVATLLPQLSSPTYTISYPADGAPDTDQDGYDNQAFCALAEVATTDPTILSVKFVKNSGNGYGNLQVGKNPKGEEGTPGFKGGGDILFPDARTHQTSTQGNNFVRVRAYVSNMQVGDIVTFQSFDPDDPSSDALIDTNDQAGKTGNDNNGALTNPANNGGSWIPKASENGGFRGYLAELDENGVQKELTELGRSGQAKGVVRLEGARLVAEVDLITSFAPGDNYIVRAYRTGDNIDPDLNLDVTQAAPANQSPQLSIWRFMNVEYDKMSKVTTADFGTYRISAQANEYEQKGDNYLVVPLTAMPNGDPIEELEDNRFAGGILRLNGTNYRVTSNEYKNNLNYVTIIKRGNLPLAANQQVTIYEDDYGISTGGLNMLANNQTISSPDITSITQLAGNQGRRIVIDTKLPMIKDYYADGYLTYFDKLMKVESNTENGLVTVVYNETAVFDYKVGDSLLGLSQIYRKLDNTLPFVVTDPSKDLSGDVFQLMQGANAGASWATNRVTNRFADAYLTPRFTDTAVFNSNAGLGASSNSGYIDAEANLTPQNSDTLTQETHGTYQYNSAYYWTVYAFQAYEAADFRNGQGAYVNQDFDGVGTTSIIGQAFLAENERRYAILYMESIRDFFATERYNTDIKNFDEFVSSVLVHEIGHLLTFENVGAGHLDNGGHREDPYNIMRAGTNGYNIENYYFYADEIGFIRRLLEIK